MSIAATPYAELLEAAAVTYIDVDPEPLTTAVGCEVGTTTTAPVLAGTAPDPVPVAQRAAGMVNVTADSPAAPQAEQALTTVVIGTCGVIALRLHPGPGTVMVVQYSRTSSTAGLVAQTVE